MIKNYWWYRKKLLPYVKDWGMNIFVSLIHFKLKYNIQSTCILLQFQQQHIKGILDSQVEGGWKYDDKTWTSVRQTSKETEPRLWGKRLWKRVEWHLHAHIVCNSVYTITGSDSTKGNDGSSYIVLSWPLI